MSHKLELRALFFLSHKDEKNNVYDFRKIDNFLKMIEEKLQITVYGINNGDNLFSGTETENVFSGLSEYIKSKRFFSQELKPNLNDGYQIELFYKKIC